MAPTTRSSARHSYKPASASHLHFIKPSTSSLASLPGLVLERVFKWLTAETAAKLRASSRSLRAEYNRLLPRLQRLDDFHFVFDDVGVTLSGKKGHCGLYSRFSFGRTFKVEKRERLRHVTFKKSTHNMLYKAFQDALKPMLPVLEVGWLELVPQDIRTSKFLSEVFSKPRSLSTLHLQPTASKFINAHTLKLMASATDDLVVKSPEGRVLTRITDEVLLNAQANSIHIGRAAITRQGVSSFLRQLNSGVRPNFERLVVSLEAPTTEYNFFEAMAQDAFGPRRDGARYFDSICTEEVGLNDGRKIFMRFRHASSAESRHQTYWSRLVIAREEVRRATLYSEP